MERTSLPLVNRRAARVLASSLEDIADRLGRASSAAEFISALEDNRLTWKRIRHAAEHYGWPLPRRVLSYSLVSAERDCWTISDHDVESIIAINRQVSHVILSRQPS